MHSATEMNASPASATRMEELSRIILAYSEVTEKLQESHQKLQETVILLQEELSEKNRLLERKNRLAALGEMAAGMAHEIRNPLGGIQLYASMLAGDVKEMPASLEIVKKISGGVRRLEALVSQVLAFSKEIRVNADHTNVKDAIDRAVDMAGGKLHGSSVTVDASNVENISAWVDGFLIEQAVLNLVLNAAEAITEKQAGGKVTIRLVEELIGDHAQMILSIEDDGPGIKPQAMDRIFDPFFTTKDTGTGLGLAIVHRIVEAHEGMIVAGKSAMGGAKFELRINTHPPGQTGRHAASDQGIEV